MSVRVKLLSSALLLAIIATATVLGGRGFGGLVGVFLLLPVACAVLIGRALGPRGKLPPLWCCAECGYSFEGLQTDACPECGVIPPAQLGLGAMRAGYDDDSTRGRPAVARSLVGAPRSDG